MANGDYLSSEELKECSKALTSIKEEVHELATNEAVNFSFNTRGWPGILLTWIHDTLDCTLQLYMNDDKKTYSLWIAVSKDIEGQRYIFKHWLLRDLAPPFDPVKILGDFKQGINLCNSVKLEDLKPSGQR